MYSILVVVLVLISIALVALILVQHGKGADAGAAFGSGASGTVFGARGSATFLSRATSWLAASFFVVTLVLAYLANHRSTTSNSVVDRLQSAGAPAATASASVQPAAKLVVPSASSAASTPAAPSAVDRTGAPESTQPTAAGSSAKPSGTE